MTLRLLIVTCFLCHTVVCYSSQYLVVTGHIERADAALLNAARTMPSFTRGDTQAPQIRVIFNSELIECSPKGWRSFTYYDLVSKTMKTESRPTNALCAAAVPDGIQHLRVEVTLPGYQTYSKNIASLAVGPFSQTMVDLGTVTLVRQPLPTVEHILLLRTDAGTFRFQVAIHNTLPQSFLIREILLEGKGSAAPTCFEPFRYTYDLGDAFIVTKVEARKRVLLGKLYELTGVHRFYVKVRGTLTNECPGTSATLSLTMPVEVVLPATHWTVLEMQVPARIAIKNDLAQSTAEPSTNVRVMPKSVSIDPMFFYHFSFQIGDGVSIHGFYDGN